MRKVALLLAACASAALVVPTAVAHPAGDRTKQHDSVTLTPIASGLDSPRGLAFLRDGRLYVAEAGHGGKVCVPDLGCLGLTGKVSQVDVRTGAHRPVVSGLASFLDPEGGAVSIDGLSSLKGKVLLGIMGLYPKAIAQIDCNKIAAKDCQYVVRKATKQAGALLALRHHGYVKIADVGGYDYQFTVDNPGGATYGTEKDANPYGVLAEHDGAYVADAGANTLTRVSYRGDVNIVHRFPVPAPAEPFPSDAVPTCVARSGWHLVVADLAGRIWTVDHHGNAELVDGPTAPYNGGPHYTGCASDDYGNVYVVSMFNGTVPGPSVATTGSVVKVTPHGDVQPLVGATGLSFPNGITVGPDGALYVTVGSISPAGGIVKLTQHHRHDRHHHHSHAG